MSTDRTGLVLRGELLKAAPREVRRKDGDPFVVYEAHVLADVWVNVVSFYTAQEMDAALGSCKPGDAVELPVYGRASNGSVFLHHRREAGAARSAAAA